MPVCQPASLFLGLLTSHHVPLGHVEGRGVAICIGGVFKKDGIVILGLRQGADRRNWSETSRQGTPKVSQMACSGVGAPSLSCPHLHSRSLDV